MKTLQALITIREGMIAENKQREHLGQSMAYNDDAFFKLAEEIEAAQQKMHRTGLTWCTHCELWQVKDEFGNCVVCRNALPVI
jgi:predicted amidohydrolase YtcJ